MKKILEMRQRRAKLVADARAILDKVEAEKRAMTAEEEAQYEGMMKDVDTVRASIDREEQLIAAEKDVAGSEGRATEHEAPEEGSGEDRANPRSTPEYRAAFKRYLVGGQKALTADEARALSVGSDPGGGYTVVPEQLARQLVKKLDDELFVRRLATTLTLTGADSLGVPTLDTDPDDADWTSELLTGSEDSSMAFGKRDLKPNPLAKRIKISNKLLRLSVFDIETLVADRLRFKLALPQEKGFLSGSGSGEPLGVFTASASGINTDRDVATDNTTTAITADGLINAKYALKAQYARNASWIFHRDGVKRIRKLKDKNDQYLWQPGLQAGAADMLLDRPYYMSEFAPNTWTTGKYVGIIGDFSYYWIADALNIQIQKLVELYAATNQTGYIVRYEGDGMPVLGEAFVRVTLG